MPKTNDEAFRVAFPYPDGDGDGGGGDRASRGGFLNFVGGFRLRRFGDLIGSVGPAALREATALV